MCLVGQGDNHSVLLVLNFWKMPKLQGDRVASNLLDQVLDFLCDLDRFDHGELGQQEVNSGTNLYLSLGSSPSQST